LRFDSKLPGSLRPENPSSATAPNADFLVPVLVSERRPLPAISALADFFTVDDFLTFIAFAALARFDGLDGFFITHPTLC
jgi:hypothetical protein